MAFRTVGPTPPSAPKPVEEARPSWLILDEEIGRPGTPLDYDTAVREADSMMYGFGIGSFVMLAKDGWAIVIPDWQSPWRWCVTLETEERLRAYREKECVH